MTTPKRGRPRNPLSGTATAPVLYLRLDAETEAALETLRAFCGHSNYRETARAALVSMASVHTVLYRHHLAAVQKRRQG